MVWAQSVQRTTRLVSKESKTTRASSRRSRTPRRSAPSSWIVRSPSPPLGRRADARTQASSRPTLRDRLRPRLIACSPLCVRVLLETGRKLTLALPRRSLLAEDLLESSTPASSTISSLTTSPTCALPVSCCICAKLTSQNAVVPRHRRENQDYSHRSAPQRPPHVLQAAHRLHHVDFQGEQD